MLAPSGLHQWRPVSRSASGLVAAMIQFCLPVCRARDELLSFGAVLPLAGGPLLPPPDTSFKPGHVGHPMSDAVYEQAGGQGMLPKILGWIVVILIVVWIVSNPSGAGTSVHSWISDIFSFFQHLASG